MMEFVFFDVGGTLLKDEMSREQAFWHALDQAGFAFEPAAVAAACREAHGALGRAFLDRAIPEREAPRFWRHALYRALALETDFDLVDALIDRPLSGLAWGMVDREAVAVLDSLRRRRCRMGVLSNWDQGLTRYLREKGLADYFEVIVSSGEVGVSKPHPDLFRAALERCGTAAGATAHVGDSVLYDGEPARAAGMLGVLLDRWGAEPDFAGPRIRRMSELPPVLFGPQVAQEE